MPLSGLAQFLLGQQGFSEGQKIGTPGINPNAPDPRPTIPNSGISNFLSPLNNPFLLNILAQQGRMTIAPGTTASIPSPLGIIGKAALMTQQQEQQKKQFDLQQELMRAQMGLLKAKTDAEGRAELPDYNKLVNELADDIRAESKDFSKQRSSFGLIRAAAEDPSPAGDLALIFNYMKVLDPGSTVREGEFANAQNSGSVPQRIRSLYNSIVKGTRLSAPQRADFVNRAARLYNSAAEEQRDRNARFKQRGVNAQLPEALIDPLLLPADAYRVPSFDPSSITEDPDAPDLPPLAVEEGVTPEQWGRMSEEDKALFY